MYVRVIARSLANTFPLAQALALSRKGLNSICLSIFNAMELAGYNQWKLDYHIPGNNQWKLDYHILMLWLGLAGGQLDSRIGPFGEPAHLGLSSFPIDMPQMQSYILIHWPSSLNRIDSLEAWEQKTDWKQLVVE